MQILLYLAIIPVYFLLKFIYKQDKVKEEKGLLTKIFIAGMLSIIPVIIIELKLGDLFPTEGTNELQTMLINTFISIALVEEGFKFLSAYIFTRSSSSFEHRYDAIVYCVYAALGFAVVENIIYVFQGGIITALMRAVLSVPSHCCDAVLMGYFYGLSQEQIKNKNYLFSLILLIIGIFIPTVEHTIYDGMIFMAQIENVESVAWKYIVIDLIMTVFTYIICFVIVKTVAKIPKNFDGSIPEEKQPTPVQIVQSNHNTSYCTNCGSLISGNYCPNCGQKRV